MMANRLDSPCGRRDWRAGSPKIRSCRINGGLHVAGRAIDVTAEIELQSHVGRASWLDEVISVMPAMWLNWRSSGVATEAAMICALAPGKPAETLMVGKSTCGNGATGKTANADGAHHGHRDGEKRGAYGRWMNGAEMFIAFSASGALVVERCL